MATFLFEISRTPNKKNIFICYLLNVDIYGENTTLFLQIQCDLFFKKIWNNLKRKVLLAKRETIQLLRKKSMTLKNRH